VTPLRAEGIPGPDVTASYVVVTEDCRAEHVAVVGGKAVGLGSLLRAGQRVPPSFVVTASAYREYVQSRPHRLSKAVRESVAQAYSALGESALGESGLGGGGLTVAVRSSAAVEDSAQASWAGQFQTFLGARGVDEVLDRIEQCWAAALAPHVGTYGADRRIGDEGGVAVIVQELVHARAAGVMFTRHPKTGDRSLVVIESSYGLGEAVVGGEVTPDLFEVNKITRQRHSSRLGGKHTEYRLAPDGRGVQASPVDAGRQLEWSISEHEVTALVTMAAELEDRLGRGLDIEWAIGTTGSAEGEETTFALQVRPITVQPAPVVPASRPGPAAGQDAGPDLDSIGHILSRLAGREPRGEA
jgi:phosphoenolpyruvate synthase/pyruvate phosphate dikinase